MTRAGDLLPEALTDALPADLADCRANWIEVARKDVADLRRSWILWMLSGLFAVVMLLPSVLWVSLGASGRPFRVAFGLPSLLISLIVPLVAISLGYGAVGGEREAGNLQVLLGLPITRRDVVLGKFLGRSVVLLAMLLVGLAIVGAEIWYFSADFLVGAYVIYAGTTLMYGLVFLGIGVGLSALFRSRARAISAAVGVYTLLTFVWHVVPTGVLYLLTRKFPGEFGPLWNPPDWFVFLGNVNPTNSYYPLFQELVPGIYPRIRHRGTLEYQQYSVEAPGPFYLQAEFLLAVMLLWGFVPLVLGAWRFSRSDLG